MIETNRLKIYAASQEEMETFIASQSVDALKAAVCGPVRFFMQLITTMINPSSALFQKEKR